MPRIKKELEGVIMQKWYWKFPLDVYALGPVEANGEKDSRAKAREWAGVSRLPAGFQTWRA